MIKFHTFFVASRNGGVVAFRLLVICVLGWGVAVLESRPACFCESVPLLDGTEGEGSRSAFTCRVYTAIICSSLKSIVHISGTANRI